MSRLVALGLLSIALPRGLAGCSIAIMEKPPDRVGEGYPVCSESAGAPIADLALAALAGIAVFAVWEDGRGNFDDDQRNVLLFAGALGALHATSAVFGGRWMSDCSAKRAAWERERLRFARPSQPRTTPYPAIAPPARPPRGALGKPCYPNGTCNPGLTCTAATCAGPPPAAQPR